MSVYNTTFYSIAKSLLSALYCHGYGKFGLGGGGGGELEMYCDSYSKFGQVLGGGGGGVAPPCLTMALICIATPIIIKMSGTSKVMKQPSGHVWTQSRITRIITVTFLLVYSGLVIGIILVILQLRL